MPLFRFLMFRWGWRIFLWALFLWRVSRVNLQLVPTHPDMSAGLGFLAEGQRRLAPIVFAGGAVIAGQAANAIRYEGATLDSLKLVMIGYGVFAILLLIAPLLLVSPRLIKVKRQGILDYGALANSYTQSFDDKWVHGKPLDGESVLGTSDIQSLADLSNSFAIVREMRPVPVNKNTIIALAVAAALPLVPVLLLATPADQLLRVILRMLGALSTFGIAHSLGVLACKPPELRGSCLTELTGAISKSPTRTHTPAAPRSYQFLHNHHGVTQEIE